MKTKKDFIRWGSFIPEEYDTNTLYELSRECEKMSYYYDPFPKLSSDMFYINMNKKIRSEIIKRENSNNTDMNKNFNKRKTNLSTSIDFSNERRITGDQTTYEPFKSVEPAHVSTTTPQNSEISEEANYITIYNIGSDKYFFVGTLTEIEQYLTGSNLSNAKIFELKSKKPISFKLQTTTKLVIE